MNISAEEKLMYAVMKAIYDSGIPMNFKGSMVLKACLLEAGFTEETRHTVDIDANWYSDTAPSAEQMVESLQKALQNCGIDLNVNLYRMYGEGRSAGFELSDTAAGDVLFTMDVDVNRPTSKTKIYEVDGIHFCGVAPSQMIADKISAISTDKVFRRIKDVVDLYYISKVFAFNKAEVLETLKTSGRSLDSFNGFLHRPDDLRHSYEKFRFSGNVDKPPFDEVYRRVKVLITTLNAIIFPLYHSKYSSPGVKEIDVFTVILFYARDFLCYHENRHQLKRQDPKPPTAGTCLRFRTVPTVQPQCHDNRFYRRLQPF